MGRFVKLMQLLPKDVTFKTDNPDNNLSEEELYLKKLGIGKYSNYSEDEDDSYLVQATMTVGRWEEKVINIDPDIVDIIEETDMGVMLETSSGRSIHVSGSIEEVTRIIEGLGGKYRG